MSEGKKVVTFGEIMMRLSPPGRLRFSQARSFDVIYGAGRPTLPYRWPTTACRWSM